MIKRFSTRKEKVFRALYEDGDSSIKIAKRFKTSPRTILDGIRRAGGKIRSLDGNFKLYFIKPMRESVLKHQYHLSYKDIVHLYKIQRGRCLWCKSKLPNELKDLISCCVDHIGGKKTKNRKSVRGLCCSDGACNRFAGMIEKNPQKDWGLLTVFAKRVLKISLRDLRPFA